MQPQRSSRRKPVSTPDLRAALLPYQKANVRRSIWQMINTLIPYLVLWYLMYLSLAYSYAITLLLSVVAAGFLVRTFIILHDCGHGSFFPSQKANNILGSICGVLTFTPYFQWRHDHAMHHATTGNLDRRGYGDVYTMTVSEYLSLNAWGRFKYCVFRHPLLLLTVGPLWTFLVSQRRILPHSGPRERWSVRGTNAVLLAIVVTCALTMGIGSYLMVQIPIIVLAATMALWLFYCQHQFEDTYWARHETWDFETAALRGSSYFRMSRVLQWFTGNIGFHHIHHLNPRIPNYYLEASHQAHPRFQEATTMTFWSSRAAFTLKLWDEERQKLVRLRGIRASTRAQAPEWRVSVPVPGTDAVDG